MTELGTDDEPERRMKRMREEELDLDKAPWLLRNVKEENGKTIKENNMARAHQIPVGALVELSTGVRMFVYAHQRDCDGTPLYGLSTVQDAGVGDHREGCHSEASLRVAVRRPHKFEEGEPACSVCGESRPQFGYNMLDRMYGRSPDCPTEEQLEELKIYYEAVRRPLEFLKGKEEKKEGK